MNWIKPGSPCIRTDRLALLHALRIYIVHALNKSCDKYDQNELNCLKFLNITSSGIQNPKRNEARYARTAPYFEHISTEKNTIERSNRATATWVHSTCMTLFTLLTVSFFPALSGGTGMSAPDKSPILSPSPKFCISIAGLSLGLMPGSPPTQIPP